MMDRRGFTLLELLVAMAILVGITGIVYASFSSVVDSVQSTRASMEEMRLRQFLNRSFTTNLSAVYTDPGVEQEVYNFVGVREEGAGGSRDSLRFTSTAPLIGGMGLPGDIKEVRYEVVTERDTEMELSYPDAPGLDSESPPAMLAVHETPLLGGNVQELAGEDGSFVPDTNFEPPSWSVPIHSLRLTYFDGADWVDEWDALEYGRVPWAVRVHINFAKTEERLEAERRAGLDPQDNPDIEMVITLQPGLGMTDELVMDGMMTGGGPQRGENGDEAEPGGGGRERPR